ncbi:LysE family translocator [Vibrio gazogenes]|uniref:Resistance to homoserine/threonine (RhtB) family protein n=1 Tax=Vibrio gazogenes DSM 21264 = NBRC 103151 TaxID=1123492 RepID=A0A1M5GKE8_VIBGA|nr:LysE family translocator [Vibrio gazogenes]USP13853.1 LysE family translocator [Vibrio gazogenes]SHG04166.1 resistance to homoserine/threonine (RhtB) family protein [Vibrio gazogenes DSM 21264] [Vibrio gazogenes DSM 21264 = NBRC 103151]SJN53255.1 Threonine efflux protein [Vibrio gazogenes]
MNNEYQILLTLASIHWIALMSPGPDFALVIQNATRYGRTTGIYIALGLSFGILIHSILSLTGISLIVHTHPVWFALIQIAGGSYLAWLGLSTLSSLYQRKKTRHQPETLSPASLWLDNRKQAFSKGFLTNLLNPKALVFFISLMSSLIPADFPASGKMLALVILWGLSFFWFAILAWLLSSPRLQNKLHAAAVYIDGLCGIIFSVLGLMIGYHAVTSLTSLS